MPLRRVHLEAGLLTASTARLAHELATLGRGLGPQILALGLLSLAALALVLEFARGERAALALALSPGPPYSARRADSPGLALGALAAPSVLAALAAVVSSSDHSTTAGPWLEWLQASLAGTLLALMALAASTRVLGPGWERLPKKGGGGNDDNAPSATQRQLASAAARAATSRAPFSTAEVTYMAACAASAAMVMLPVASKGEAGVGGHAAATTTTTATTIAAEAALLAAVAGVPLATHAVMRLLPGCFSLGEGLALGQGLAAVLVGAAVQAPLAVRAFVPPTWQAAVAKAAAAAAVVVPGARSSASSAPPPPAWVFAAAAPAPATALPAFVVTLLAATLVLAACGAMLWPWVVRAAGLGFGGLATTAREEESEEEEQEADQAVATTPARRRRRTQQQEQPQRTPKKAKRPAKQPPSPPPLPPLPVRLGALLLAAAALLYVLLLARWTLDTFIPAGGCRRVGLLAYWVAVLGVSLPAMGFAARLRLKRWGGGGGRNNNRRLPPLLPRIVLRKGYHLVALALFLPAFYADLPLLCVALAIAFAALVATEGVRVGGAAVAAAAQGAGTTATAPPFFLARLLRRASAALQGFMGGFVDSRDAGGAVYVTHFTLLLGIALPIWLAACGLPPAARAVRADGASLQALAPGCLFVDNGGGGGGGGVDPCSSGGGAESASATVRWVSAALGPRGRAIVRGARGAAAALCASAGLGAPPLAAALPSLADLLAKMTTTTANASTTTATTTPAPYIATPLPVVLAGLAGAAIIGVGDTAASAAGKLLGRIPVHSGSRKTVEGTAAGVLCTLVAWAPLVALAGGRVEGGGGGGGTAAAVWGGMVGATLGAGLLEAATSQLDNLLIPLYYMPHLLLAVGKL